MLWSGRVGVEKKVFCEVEVVGVAEKVCCEVAGVGVAKKDGNCTWFRLEMSGRGVVGEGD